MKSTTLLKSALIAALLTFTPAYAVKYVAVVETGVDERSGASSEITSAEVALMTAELRREAVKNLPRDRFSVMTSETVQSMGGAVLEECAEENCVITLGSRIGADYIVRGTISKFQTRLTLSVEIYETDNGTLVAFSDPIRSENAAELLEKTAPVCASMYKSFAEAQNVAEKPQLAAVDDEPKAEPKAKPKKEKAPPKPKPEPKPKPAPKPKPERAEPPPMRLSVGGAAFFAGDFGGGLSWEGSGESLSMPYYGGGACLFFDAAYAEALIGYSAGGGKWGSPANTTGDAPDASRSCVNIGVFAKYPVVAGGMSLFPLIGVDYEASVSGKRVYGDGTEVEPEGSTSAVWFKFGGGADFNISGSAYLRVELLYGVRTSNECESNLRDEYTEQYPELGVAQTRLGNGVTVRAGVGVGF